MRKLEVGATALFSKTIAECDVYSYAGIIGDFNPIHVNKVAGEQSVFGDRVAHGMLVGSLISTVLGNKLPGEGTIYLEQTLKFKKPVFFGDTVTAKVKVSEIVNFEKGIYKLETTIVNQNGDLTHDGYAIVKII